MYGVDMPLGLPLAGDVSTLLYHTMTLQRWDGASLHTEISRARLPNIVLPRASQIHFLRLLSFS
jgi:hypothetical protein